MPDPAFHDKPFDPGTLTKLKIFELYTQEWVPVFLSSAQPPFPEVHIFDFFCGPGMDSIGQHGSPLRVLSVLRRYQERGLAGWDKVTTVAHFFGSDAEKIARLNAAIQGLGGGVPGVNLDVRAIPFASALTEYDGVLKSARAAKLLIIDQFGVDEVSDEVFDRLVALPKTDFIFFLSSSTLHRFRDHPAIKQKIERPEDSYHVHRAAFEYYRGRLPKNPPIFWRPSPSRRARTSTASFSAASIRWASTSSCGWRGRMTRSPGRRTSTSSARTSLRVKGYWRSRRCGPRRSAASRRI